MTRLLSILLAGLWAASVACAQPVTLRELGCVPDDPSVDNGAIVRQAIIAGRVRGEIICGPGPWYHTTPLSDCGRDGVSFRGAGVAMWNTQAGAMRRERRGPAALFIYTGPPHQPAWKMTGFGWRLTGINLWHGWKGDLACAGTGIEISRTRNGPPAGKALIDHCTIANFETGVWFKRSQTHADNVASTWLLCANTRTAIKCDNPQTTGMDFAYLFVGQGCDRVFQFTDGGNLRVGTLQLTSPALIFDLQSTRSNTCAYMIENLKVDNRASGWRLVELDDGPLRLRVGGMIGRSAEPGPNPLVVPAGSDVQFDLWRRGQRWQWNN